VGLVLPYPSGAPEFTTVFSGVPVVRCSVFWAVFYRSLFVLFLFLSWLHGTINYAFNSNVDNCQPRITYENLSAYFVFCLSSSCVLFTQYC
jgi:hypothetical protein